METQSQLHKSGIIEIVARAPVIYLIIFFLGALANYFYPIPLSAGDLAVIIGFVFIILGPLLILWAQVSLQRFKVAVRANDTSKNFAHGPYCYTRNPTYLGLTLLIIGFGLFANSLFIIISALLAFVIVNLTVLQEEESIMVEKYGEDYRQYQKTVRRWF